jgi:hypothetical protein
VNNEVLVAELLAREGGGQPVPPASRSRWRVVAVLAAIVLGCGIGVVLDRAGTPAEQQARPVGQSSAVDMPQHSDGSVSAGTTLEPTSSAVPGTDVTDVNAPPPSTTAGQPPNSAAPPAAQTSVNAGTPTTGAPASTTSHATPTSPRPTSTPQQPPPTTKKPCVLGIFC